MKFSILFLLLLLPWLGSGCSDDKAEAPDTFEIPANLLTQEFTQTENTVSVFVKTSLSTKEWQVNSDKDWCKVTKLAASFTITVSENTDAELRTATIKVTSPVQNYDIKITQLGWGKKIILNEHNISVGADGKDITLRVTANIEYRMQDTPDWIVQQPGNKASTDRDYNFTVKLNPTYGERRGVIRFIGQEDASVTDSCIILQSPRSSNVNDVEIEGDILIVPTGGKASENQPGQGIEHCWDGKFMSDGAAPYHSVWNQSANFPVTLEFYFDGTQDIDYLIYYTRSGNGNFGKFKLYTITENATTYTQYGDIYDFKKQNAASKVSFPGGLKKVKKIKFEVLSGAGDFVSCDEMQFYKKSTGGTLDQRLLTVFTDITCSEIKTGVTQAQIDALPGYFARVATALQNGEYNEWQRNFRIRDYEAYSDVEEWAEKLMTKRYSNLDNCTGIYASAGDTIFVLVGNTHGQAISIQSIPGTASSGDSYFLEEGVNKIGIRNDGMLFIMYTANPGNEPIRVHIPIDCGTVNGFFDLKEHQTDEKYAELLRKSTYKYFLVRGEKIIFYFHREKLMEFVPNNILSAINLWDNIIGWQQELMGIEDVRPSQVNNHIFAISPEEGYMWASHYQIGFVYTYLDNILLYDKVMSAQDNAWGPAHEIGHIHQQAINWPSSTESSNNLFSNFVIYKLGKYCSRGTELSALAIAHCINNQPWVLMGTSTHQNEDTEIHMRMNWQLWNYYHRCGFKPDFWQKLFKLLRTDPIIESDPGAGQLKFAVKACEAAQEDLTEFFEMWGLFVPVDNISYEQYGTWNYNVTQAMIDEAKAKMAQYPKKAKPFYYLEDRKNGDVGIGNYKVGDVGYYTQFKENVKITKTVTATRSGQKITIHDGKEAVAFEIRSGNSTGKLLFFSNFLEFEVPASVSLDGTVICAVQADGERKVITVQ